uniref:Reverse transcriptase domain-containing protein n=1 Tax=Latimeria chalumnae TaxID=7897 RepID=H3AKN8_LATCH
TPSTKFLQRNKLRIQSTMSDPFTLNELNAALSATKSGKAAGPDGVYPEFLKALGPKAKRWLTFFFSKVLATGKFPSIWREAKIIALLKQGKNASEASSYRPISLLCTCYKVLERLLLHRLAPTIEPTIP